MRWLGAGLPVCGQCRQLPNPSCLRRVRNSHHSERIFFIRANALSVCLAKTVVGKASWGHDWSLARHLVFGNHSVSFLNLTLDRTEECW